MTVKELLDKMEGVSSYGVYTKSGEIENTHTDSKTIIKYLDRKVDRFNIWIYDELDKTIFGKEYNAKRIRCCIYLED